jgi:hypothetical protein
MGEFVGGSFEDYGNVPEVVLPQIRGWEIMDGDLVRLFVCKQVRGG